MKLNEMDSQLRKKVGIESKFADSVYRNFVSLRFGLTPCCVIDQESAALDKESCDWNDLVKATENIGSATGGAVSQISTIDENGITVWTTVDIEELLERIEVLETSTLVDEKDLNYVHTQVTPSTTWTIIHNLGKKPSVRVEDTNGIDVVGEITYNSDAIVTVTFLTPIAGTAYLN